MLPVDKQHLLQVLILAF